MKVLLVLMCSLAIVMTAGTVYASDINFGSYARSVAMGGAGLAMTDDASSSSIVNPAAAAAIGKKFQFVFPSFDLRVSGADLSDLTDRTSEISSGNDDDALKLIRDFGKQDTTLNFGVVTGFSGAFGVTAEGEAQAVISPSSSFSEWAIAGTPTSVDGLKSMTFSDDEVNTVIQNALADDQINGTDASDIVNAISGSTNLAGKYVYALPAVNLGRGFDTTGGKLWLGTRMRWLHSEAHKWNVSQEDGVTDSIELDVTETQNVEDDGFGADLGLIYQPKNSFIQYGMVINNFWDAKLEGIETPRMYSLGIAAQPNNRWKFAADLVNINKAYDEDTKLRMGAELNLTNKIALRAGYSGDSFTYGFGLYGINLAFSDDAPSIISRVLSF
ncbi:conjugal transfer protein TraF [bacterium]|nr:conjugal transfer protein TraF [bacterium]